MLFPSWAQRRCRVLPSPRRNAGARQEGNPSSVIKLLHMENSSGVAKPVKIIVLLQVGGELTGNRTAFGPGGHSLHLPGRKRMLRSLPSPAGEGQGSASARFPLFTPQKHKDDTRGRELARAQRGLALSSHRGDTAPVMMSCRQEAGLAHGVTLVATEGPRGQPGHRPGRKKPQRIQFLDEVVGVLVVLGKEAEGHSCHRVVTPGPVEAAEEVTAFLGKERDIGVRSPAGARTWH